MTARQSLPEPSPDAASPGWYRHVIRVHGCSHPVRLAGQAVTVDPTNGEVLAQTASGHLLVPCGNRRAAVCPTCAEVYRADTFQLIRAGLVGGKGTPEGVRTHPQVFVTLTAPGFGLVHTRRDNGRACRPRRTSKRCPHGTLLTCTTHHADADPLLGQSLCPDCYDYVGAVLWQAHAGQLWHRFALQLRREVAHAAGLGRRELADVARLSYAKVAEFQRRGLVHFHAVIRLDGPDGGGTPPPPWADAALLASAVRTAALGVNVTAPGADLVGVRVLVFGRQLDVRPVAPTDALGSLTPEAVAGYIAKYATKGADAAGVTVGRIRRESDLADLPLTPHLARMVATCWHLGGLEPFKPLRLRRWAHMLGFRGHFSTKSRRYSTTLTALRAARTDYRTTQRRRALGIADRPSLVVADWRYAGRGYTATESSLADALRTASTDTSDPSGRRP